MSQGDSEATPKRGPQFDDRFPEGYSVVDLDDLLERIQEDPTATTPTIGSLPVPGYYGEHGWGLADTISAIIHRRAGINPHDPYILLASIHTLSIEALIPLIQLALTERLPLLCMAHATYEAWDAAVPINLRHATVAPVFHIYPSRGFADLMGVHLDGTERFANGLFLVEYPPGQQRKRFLWSHVADPAHPDAPHDVHTLEKQIHMHRKVRAVAHR